MRGEEWKDDERRRLPAVGVDERLLICVLKVLKIVIAKPDGKCINDTWTIQGKEAEPKCRVVFNVKNKMTFKN